MDAIIVSYEAIRSWCQKFDPDYVRKLKRRQSRLGDIWHLDESSFELTANNSIFGVPWIKTAMLSTSWFSRTVIGAPRNDSFEDCCTAREKNHFVSLPTNSEATRPPCGRSYAMWLTTRNVTATIAPKVRISPLAKGNGTCADSNLLAKPNGFSPSTVSSRIFSE